MQTADTIDALIQLTNTPLDLTQAELRAWRAIMRQSRPFRGAAKAILYHGTTIAAEPLRRAGGPRVTDSLLTKTQAAGRRVVDMAIGGWVAEIERVARDPDALRRILNAIPAEDQALLSDNGLLRTTLVVAGACLQNVHLQVAREVEARTNWPVPARMRTLRLLGRIAKNDFGSLSRALPFPRHADGVAGPDAWRRLVGEGRSAFHDRTLAGNNFHCPAHSQINRLLSSGAMHSLNQAVAAEIDRRLDHAPVRPGRRCPRQARMTIAG